MHELALAEAVVATALRTAEREQLSRLTRLVVRIGELQAIERDVFAFALEQVLPAAEPRLASVAIELETEAARFRCRPCGREFGLAEAGRPAEADAAEAIHFVPELAHAFLRCPACRSPDFQVTRGRGVVLHTLEGI